VVSKTFFAILVWINRKWYWFLTSWIVFILNYPICQWEAGLYPWFHCIHEAFECVVEALLPCTWWDGKKNPDSTDTLDRVQVQSNIFWVDGEQSKLWCFSKQPFIGFVQSKMF